MSQPVERWVRDMRLEIKVSRDEESAAVTLSIGGEAHELHERTFLYLLAFLARRRIDDEAAGHGPNAGWIDVEMACDELGLPSPEALGLLVYRCRKAIKDCGVDDPAAIVDRSRRGQLRIGVEVEQLLVTRLD